MDADRTVDEVATLHLGPDKILVALTLSFKRALSTETLRAAIKDLTADLRKADRRVAYVYVRPAPERAGGRKRAAQRR